MQRKLIKQGPGSGGYTVYVPKEWVEKQDLAAGDTVEIEEEGGDLVLSSDTGTHEQPAEITLDSTNEWYIRTTLNHIYRLGYDTVHVSITTEEQAGIIERLVDERIPGYEVVERSENSVRIETMSEPNSEKQDVLRRRIFHVVSDSLKTLRDDIREGKLEQHDYVERQTAKLDEYDNFLRRSINKANLQGHHAPVHWSEYTYLLLIQHSVLHLYEEATAEDVDEHIRTIFEQLYESFSTFEEAFFERDVDGIHTVNEREHEHLYEEILPLTEVENGKIVYYAGELSRLIYNATIPALALLLEQRGIVPS